MAVSLTELLDVIKKSGLPLGERLTKTQKDIDNEQLLRGGVQDIYQPQFDQLDEEKKGKIQALANVDKQFSSMFGKGGKYALENPMNTESLTAQGQNIALSDFSRVATKKNDLLKAFEKDVADAVTLYGKVDPLKSEGDGTSLADFEYLRDTYGINVPGIETLPESEWEVSDLGGEWEIDSSGDLKVLPEKPNGIIKEETPKKKLFEPVTLKSNYKKK